MITKCPKCQTVFNVKKDQLSAANGLVRCGSCMTVFNALSENAQNQPSSQAQAPADAQGHRVPLHTQASAQNQLKTKSNVSLQSNASTKASQQQQVGQQVGQQVHQQNLGGNSDIAQSRPSSNAPNVNIENPKNQQWSGLMNANLQSIDNDLDKLEQEVQPLRKKSGKTQPQEPYPPSDLYDQLDMQSIGAPSPLDEDDTEDSLSEELSNSFKGLGSNNNSDPFFLETGTNEPTPILEDEESWAESLLEELDEDNSALEAFEPEDTKKTDTKEPKKPKEVTFDTSRMDQDIADFFVTSDAIDYEPATDEPNRSKEKPKKAEPIDLNQLNDEPVDSDARYIRRSGKRWGYLTLFLCVICLIAGQYIYYHFDQLAKDKFWRPKLAFACKHIGCTLKAPMDPSQLKTVSVSMREHPSLPNFLLIDAIIYSVAEIPVPFPELVLNFTDINDDSTTREFVLTPSEYRKGDLLQYDALPPEKSIQINFEIEDPGLTNYSLNFKYSP